MNFVHSDGDEGEVIQAVTLDEFCEGEGIDHIDILKIDVQGNEENVLRGAVRMLTNKKVRTIFMEVNSNEAVNLLVSFGYSVEWQKNKADVIASIELAHMG